MAVKTIEATSGPLQEAGIEKVSVDYEIPETIDGLVEAFGEDVVKSHVISSIVIALQGRLRGWAKNQLEKDGKIDADKLQKAANEWKPGQARPKMSAVEKAAKALEKMTPEELAQYKKMLEEKLASL